MPTIPGFPQQCEDEHMTWHMGAMGGFPGRAFPAGTPGSGREFLQFHHGYMNRVLAWYAAQPGANPLRLEQDACASRWIAFHRDAPRSGRLAGVGAPQPVGRGAGGSFVDGVQVARA